MVSSCCSTSDTYQVTPVIIPVISHEWAKDRIVIKTKRTCQQSSQQNFRSQATGACNTAGFISPQEILLAPKISEIPWNKYMYNV